VLTHRYHCDACERSAWDVEAQRLWCRKNLLAFPHAGDLCDDFERYPGAEPSEEVAA